MTLHAVDQRITLSLGEWAVSDKPDDVLVCLGLGSCIAFAAHDKRAGVAGMAHMVLPDSSQGKPTGAAAKFVDRAIPLVIAEMEALGAERPHMKIHIAGGARMLAGAAFQDKMLIGERNREAVDIALKPYGLRITTDETGGDHGRTVQMSVGTGVFDVHSGVAKRKAA
jgi:chemotaxis protein CheD